MKYTPQQILDLAKSRGFTVHMSSPHKNWYSMMSDKSPVALQLWTDKDEFQIVYAHGIATLTSGKCSPFSSEKQFKRIANEMHKLAMKLKA